MIGHVPVTTFSVCHVSLLQTIQEVGRSASHVFKRNQFLIRFSEASVLMTIVISIAPSRSMGTEASRARPHPPPLRRELRSASVSILGILHR